MSLEKIREEIDAVDTRIKELFLKRMELSGQVIEEKKRTGGSIYVPEREAAVIAGRMEGVDKDQAPEYEMFLKQVMAISRTYQYSHLDWPEPLKELSGFKGEILIRFACPQKTDRLPEAVVALKMAGIQILRMQTEAGPGGNMACQMKLAGDFGSSLAKGAILQIYGENEEVLVQKNADA